MKQLKEKLTKLRNSYTGEVVITSNLFNKRIDNDLTFIQVYKPEEPQRKYFVNEAAFIPLDK